MWAGPGACSFPPAPSGAVYCGISDASPETERFYEHVEEEENKRKAAKTEETIGVRTNRSRLKRRTRASRKRRD